jgi:hypothetical protein
MYQLLEHKFYQLCDNNVANCILHIRINQISVLLTTCKVIITMCYMDMYLLLQTPTAAGLLYHKPAGLITWTPVAPLRALVPSTPKHLLTS